MGWSLAHRLWQCLKKKQECWNRSAVGNSITSRSVFLSFFFLVAAKAKSWSIRRTKVSLSHAINAHTNRSMWQELSPTRRYVDIDWARVRWRLPRTTVHSSHFKAIRCAWLHTKRLLCWVCWWWVITDKLSSTIRTDSDNLVSYWSGWGREVESDLTWSYSWHRETSWKNKEEEKKSLSEGLHTHRKTRKTWNITTLLFVPTRQDFAYFWPLMVLSCSMPKSLRFLSVCVFHFFGQ